MKNNSTVFLAHGIDKNEISKFDFVSSNDYFSIAIYFNLKEEKLEEFNHSHPEYEFIIPLDVIPILVYEKALYIGEVGYCYPINPYVNHGIGMKLDSRVVSIAFDKDYFENLKEKLGKKDKFFYTRFLISKELSVLVQQYYFTKNKNLIERIASCLINEGLKDDIDRRKKPYNYYPYLKDSIIYILENYNNPDLTIDDIAKVTPYSRAYYTKAFKKYMDDTPINYLNRMRISKARELVGSTNLSLTEIAKLSGYKSPSKFCEAFKRITGMKPIEYKRNIRKENIENED